MLQSLDGFCYWFLSQIKSEKGWARYSNIPILFKELDGDQKKLSAHGRIASRDIVQFVELRKFLQGNYWSKELLAKEVLAEIPQQFVGWMKAHGINPKNVPGKH